MLFRFLSVFALSSLLATSLSAQTVRFDTNVGTIDFELNPTGNANLQGHVDNMLAYVNSGRYDQTVVHRAVERVAEDPTDDFVLQMGGFLAPSFTIPGNFNDLPAVAPFNPVVVDTTGDNDIDFDTTGFTNTRGTVTLALSSSRTTSYFNDPGSPQVNSGTSSFFINLGNNSNLDPGVTTPVFRDPERDNPALPSQTTVVTGGFIPFATVDDLSTVDLIMALNQRNYDDGGIVGDDFPFFGNNRAVIIERAFVLEEQTSATVLAPALSPAAAPTTASELSQETVAAAAVVASSEPIANSSQIASIPEPSTLWIATSAMLLLAHRSRRRPL